MIKVIAVDMDGTLLNERNDISEETLDAIRKAEEAGIEIIIATGRGYHYAMSALEKHPFKRRYLLMSGGEVRDEQERIERQILLDYETILNLYEKCQEYDVMVHFCGDEFDYAVGTDEEIYEGMCKELCSFTGFSREVITNAPIFKTMFGRIKKMRSIEEIRKYPVFKAFIFSDDSEMLAKLDGELQQIPNIASASSFRTNLEITDIRAQKGLVLKEMVEARGYALDEVMALGDSLNDESMLAMPIGAAVSMGNAHEKLKKICPYCTKTNVEHGVAYVIEKVLEGRLEDLRNPECEP